MIRSKNRAAPASADDITVMKIYKSELRKTRFYIDKTAKTVSAFAPLNYHKAKNEKWASNTLDKEIERLKDNVSLSTFTRPFRGEPVNKRNRSKDEGMESPGISRRI